MPSTPAPARPRLRTILGRGLRGRCPHCGNGELFQRWVITHERCSSCRYLIQRNYGDIWMFTNLMDRVPIIFGVAAFYFGFRATNWWMGLAFLLAMAAPMIATIRHRQGIALALDYVWRL